MPPPPEGFMEYLAMLSQSGALPFPVPQHLSQPATSIPTTPPTPTPPATEARLFNRAGRGTGGALSEKQKVSKQITAPASKRKSTLDSDAEIELSPSLEAAESANLKQKKRVKTGKATTRAKPKPKALPKLSNRTAYPTPALTDPEPIVSPISTPVPPTSIRPTPRSTKPIIKVKVQSPEPQDIDIDDNDVFALEVQEDESVHSGEDSDPDADVPVPANNGNLSMALQMTNTQSAVPPVNLVQAFLSHFGVATIPQVQPPPAAQPTEDALSAKNIKSYPLVWCKALNMLKDIIRAWILLTDPFPGPADVQVMINECFHEVCMSLVNDGLSLESGTRWTVDTSTILTTDISTSRSELKKLAKILVGVDPGLFPLLSKDHNALADRSAPEIRTIAAKMLKNKKNTPATSQPLYDYSHVRASVTSRLAQFAYLNNPPTTDGDLFASPILERLCKSFYEEDRWQRSLRCHAKGDNEWKASVTVTMISLAATAHRCALDEWRTGNFVQKIFEGIKYTKIYTEIQDYVVDCVENDPRRESALDRFNCWATESVFVQDFPGAQ
ncbi:hypothetical protein BJ322DRAFT_1105454 [Thelephora terrestris]|uniref:DUF6532 domain-containing protein n=1 Tax=Thelephora terrestris TaxID=56493 RepID=A0A9P6HLP7_9AGAM|nr:hypothetical protein BJ322DRAFT_1105454 [Thelephora terrestris]